jgi:hypothetical protein
MEKLYHKLVLLLDADYESVKCSRFVRNLLQRKKKWLFHFVMKQGVEPTNNRAERSLRPPVICRKVSGGSKSDRGTEIYRKLYSIFYKSKLRGKNFIEDTPSDIDMRRKAKKRLMGSGKSD